MNWNFKVLSIACLTAAVFLFTSFVSSGTTKKNTLNDDQYGCMLQLISVECISQEDFFGTDEVYVTVNGEKVTTTRRISTGKTLDLTNTPPIKLSGITTVQLWEYDMDDDDLLISDIVSCSPTGSKFIPSSHSGAEYRLYCKTY